MFSFFILLCFLHGISSQSLHEGVRRQDDILIHKSEHVKGPIYFTTRYDDVPYPKYNDKDGFLITYVNVVDNFEDGGSSEIDYGGIGHTFVNVHLRSRLGGGFNFTVEIYGVQIK